MRNLFSKSNDVTVPPWLDKLRKSALARSGCLVIGWLLTWQVGMLLEYETHASVWFPAAGMTYAALLIAGRKALPALIFSTVVITYWTGFYYDIPVSVGQLSVAGLAFSVAHILPYWLATLVLKAMIARSPGRLPHLIVTFLVSSAAFSLLATLMVLFSLIQTNMMPASEFSELWLAFWIGDMAGVVVMAPVFVGILKVLHPDSSFDLAGYLGNVRLKPTDQFVTKVVINLALLVLGMWLAKVTDAPESAFAIFFLALTHMWIATTESAFYNVLSLAISSFTIALLVNVFGLMDQVMVYQFAINVVAANALFGIAIPALVDDNRRLLKLVVTDSLTQASSRDFIVQRAGLEINRSRQNESCLSLILFDVDHFKHINDNFGHNAGDRALQQVAKVTYQSLRPTDIFGRMGGDEFAVVLPDSTIESALQIAGRIQQNLNDLSVGDRSLTCSFGVSELTQADSFESLYERADKALYDAKRRGRNCISPTSTDHVLRVISKE